MSWFVLSPMAMVVLAANVLGAAMAVPQALKLLQSRHVAGVSPVWAGFSATINAWWAVYGLGVGDWSIVPVSVISVMSYLVIAATLVRFTDRPRRAVVTALVAATLIVGSVPLVALFLDGWVTVGLTLGALYAVQLSPAVVAVYRAPDVSGVSVATWLFAFGEAALWGVYGVPHADPGLVALAATGVAMSSLVLVRLVVVRPRRASLPAGLGLGTA